jgi:hypothetical protein
MGGKSMRILAALLVLGVSNFAYAGKSQALFGIDKKGYWENAEAFERLRQSDPQAFDTMKARAGKVKAAFEKSRSTEEPVISGEGIPSVIEFNKPSRRSRSK